MPMQTPFLMLSLDGKEIISDEIYYFEVNYDIGQTLPYGKIIIKDSGGQYIKTLPLSIGSEVQVSIVDENPPQGATEKEKAFKPFKFMVSQVLDGFELNLDEGTGYVQIQMDHPWTFFCDYDTHAYPPMQCTDLIKKVLRESVHGKKAFDFKIEDKNFEKSSDKGLQPRYKFGENDLDFILNKVLPYTTLNLLPPYFFINHDNVPFLKSFKTMFSENPKVLITPDKSVIQDNGEIWKSVAVGKGINGAIDLENMTVIIAGTDNFGFSFQKVKRKLHYYDQDAAKTIRGIDKPKTKAGVSSGNSSADMLPLSLFVTSQIGATDSLIFNNRSLDDQVAIASADARDLDKMFQIKCTANNFLGSDLNIGDTVYFFASPTIIDGKDIKVNWLSDKWLISRVSYKIPNGNIRGLRTELTLIRPTFIMNKLNTTLNNPEFFWSVN